MTSPIKIVKGEDKTITIQLISEEDKSYYDLSDATGIAVAFKQQSGSALSKELDAGVSIVSALAGKISVTLTDTETALLKEGELLPIYVTLDVGSTKTIVVSGLEKALTVVAKPF
jgi:hypothetical protein